jgi:hypothetical protein
MARILAGVGLALALAASPAGAAVVIDQGSLVGDGLAFRNLQYHTFTPGSQAGPWGQAQSFTVGKAGRLEALSVGLLNNRTAAVPLTLRIWAGAPRRLDSPTLFQATWTAQPFRVMGVPYVAWSSLPTFDLSDAGLMVKAGDVLTFAITSTVQYGDVGMLSHANSTPFAYAGGQKYAIGNISIENTQAANIVGRIPEWHRQAIDARSFLLLPVMLKNRALGLLYADCVRTDSAKISPEQLSLLRTLRSQVVLAFKHSVPQG